MAWGASCSGAGVAGEAAAANDLAGVLDVCILPPVVSTIAMGAGAEAA
jgi:hypothetical protein